MPKYVLSRLIQTPLILAVIYLCSFFMVWVVPGDPFSNSERNLDPAKVEAMRAQLHADHWYTFLAHYPWQIIRHGDFGPSMFQQEHRVNEIIGQRFWISFRLGVVGLGIAIVVGMLVGVLAAVYRDGIIDWAGISLTLFGISVPAFVTAGLLLILFVSFPSHPFFGVGELESARDYVLPGIALSLAPMATIVQLMRVSMREVLGADYVRTARAKGLSKPTVVLRHCVRNAFLPVLTYLGPAAAATLTGSFVVERVFALPGLGESFIDSITNRDATLILALVMVYSALLVLMNMLVDLLYGFVDPRIDVSGTTVTGR